MIRNSPTWIAVVAVACICGTSGTSEAQLARTGWPTYRHDVRHTGRSPSTGPDYPVLHWSYEIFGSSQTGVILGTEGDLFFGTDQGQVISLDRNGIERWSFQSQGPIRSGPSIGGDAKLYFGSFDGCFYSIRSRTGELAWTYCIGTPISSPSALDETGRIYFGATDGIVRCLEPDGTLVWENNVGGSITAAAPSLDAEHGLYIGGYGDAGLAKLDRRTGTILWNYTTVGPPRNTAAIHDNGNIYVGTREGWFYCISPDGQELWSVDVGAEIRTSAAVAYDGTVIVGAFDGYLHAFDPDTGTTQWSSRIGMAIEGSPVVSRSGVTYVGGIYAGFFAINSEGVILHRLGRSAADGVASIDGDQRIYVGEEGAISAYGPVRPLAKIYASRDRVGPSQHLWVSVVTENRSGYPFYVDRRAWEAGPDGAAVSILADDDLLLQPGARDSVVVIDRIVAPGEVMGSYHAGIRLTDSKTSWLVAEDFVTYHLDEDSGKPAPEITR